MKLAQTTTVYVRLLLLVVALGLAVLGQRTLFPGDENVLVQGLLWYAGAVVLFVLAFAAGKDARPVDERELPPSPWPRGWEGAKGTRWTAWTLLAVALGLEIVAAGLWVGGRHPNLALIPFGGALVAWFIGVTMLDRQRPSGHRPTAAPRWTRAEIVVFLLIIGVAVFMRWWQLGQVPIGIWDDEARECMAGQALAKGMPYSPMSDMTFRPTPSLPYYVLALFYRLFGESLYVSRCVPALFGLGTVILFHLLARMLFGRWPSLAGTFLLAVQVWHVNFSRYFMETIIAPFFAILVFYYLFRGLSSLRWKDFLWCGLWLGVGLQIYAAFRLVPVMLAILFLHQLIFCRHVLRQLWPGLLIIIFGAQLVTVSMNVYAYQQWDNFIWRTKETSIFAEKPGLEGIRALPETIKKHLLMFNFHGDANGRHGLPYVPKLDFLTGIPFALGLGYTLYRWRRRSYFTILCWFAVGLSAGILSLDFEAPQSNRAILVIPPTILFMTVVFAKLQELWRQMAPRWENSGFVVTALAVLLPMGWLNYQGYFDTYVHDPIVFEDTQGADTALARFFADLDHLPHEYALYHQRFDSVLVPFLRHGRQIGGRFFSPVEHLPLREEVNRDVMFVLEPWRVPLPKEIFLHYYPHGIFDDSHKDPRGEVMFYTFVVSATEANELPGLRMSYTALEAGEPGTVTRKEKYPLQSLVGTHAPAPGRYRAIGEGSLFVPESGLYRIFWTDGYAARIDIDGPTPPEAEGQGFNFRLAEGWHDFRLTREITVGGTPPRLYWQRQGEAEEEVPGSSFCPVGIFNHGFYGRYYRNPEWSGLPEFVRIDPTLNVRWHPDPIASPVVMPWSASWSATLQIATSGHYLFNTLSNDYSRLEIDGQPVITNPGGQGLDGTVTLSRGPHRLDLFYHETIQYSELRLKWMPPGAPDLVPIPWELLTPIVEY